MPIKKNYTGEIIIILIFFCFFPLKFSNAGIPVEKIKLEGKAKVKVTKVPIRKNYPEGRIIGTAERLEYIEIKEKIKDSESPNEWILIETNTNQGIQSGYVDARQLLFVEYREIERYR